MSVGSNSSPRRQRPSCPAGSPTVFVAPQKWLHFSPFGIFFPAVCIRGTVYCEDVCGQQGVGENWRRDRVEDTGARLDRRMSNLYDIQIHREGKGKNAVAYHCISLIGGMVLEVLSLLAISIQRNLYSRALLPRRLQAMKWHQPLWNNVLIPFQFRSGL